MEVIFIALVAFGGGIVAALLGWLESSIPFDRGKFGSSLLRALIAGVVFGVLYNYADTGVTVLDYAIAFLGGAGVDVLGNRAAGSLTTR